jgi:hypothetical protein
MTMLRLLLTALFGTSPRAGTMPAASSALRALCEL